MRRLFVALALPDMVRERIGRLQQGLEGARWIDPDNFHLTLRFAGEIDDGMADDLAAALSVIRAPAFSLRLDGLGHFESKGRPNALWVGVEPDAALSHLRDRVEAAARRAGLVPESRRFKPHVTIARLHGVASAEVSRWIAGHSPFSLPEVPAREFVLFRSHLGRSGARYEPEAVYPLTPAAGGYGRSAWDAPDTLDEADEPDWSDPNFDVADWIGGSWAPTIAAQGG